MYLVWERMVDAADRRGGELSTWANITEQVIARLYCDSQLYCGTMGRDGPHGLTDKRASDHAVPRFYYECSKQLCGWYMSRGAGTTFGTLGRSVGRRYRTGGFQWYFRRLLRVINGAGRQTPDRDSNLGPRPS